MKRMAFFVEGETECEFVEKLLQQFISQNRIHIVKQKLSGKKRSISYSDEADREFLVNITISGSDNTVNSDIKENIQDLANQDYSLVIGLKDLRGKDKSKERKLSDLPKLRSIENRMVFDFCNNYLDTKSIIAVMEIETWFIGETNHYDKISAEITKQKVLDNLDKIINNVNPYECKLEEIEKPAETLDSIYQLGGKAYDKKRIQRSRTIKALDYSNICFSLPKRLESLKELMDTLDKFFA